MMCICCDKRITLLKVVEEPLEDEEKVVFGKIIRQISGKKFDETYTSDASSNMWNGGIVGHISGNYGSRFDSDEFIIAICDDCIEKKKMTGNVAFIDNYMSGISDPWVKDDYDKSRVAWRRYNRIDDLLNGD